MVIIHSSCLLIDRSELRSWGDMQASRSAAQGNKIPAEPAVRRLQAIVEQREPAIKNRPLPNQRGKKDQRRWGLDPAVGTSGGPIR